MPGGTSCFSRAVSVEGADRITRSTSAATKIGTVGPPKGLPSWKMMLLPPPLLWDVVHSGLWFNRRIAMFRPVLVAGLAVLVGSVASAAIVYEPVQYQYADPVYGRPVFYYGGSNPRVLWAGANYQGQYHIGLNSVRNIGFNEVFVGPLADDLLHHG